MLLHKQAMIVQVVIFLLLCGPLWPSFVESSLIDPTQGLDDFFPWQFEQKVSRALDQLSHLLESHRNIQLAEHEEHTYDDKFSLVQVMATTMLQSLQSMLSRIGVAAPDNNKVGRIFLHFAHERQCWFLESIDTKVKTSEDKQRVLGVKVGSSESYHVVTEHHWRVEEEYHLYYSSVEEESIPLGGRTMTTKTKTTAMTEPVPSMAPAPSKVEVTWLFQEGFTFNRTLATTPRRNEEMDTLLSQVRKLYTWLETVHEQLDSLYLPADQTRPPLPREEEDDSMLMFPWMENSTQLDTSDWQTLLQHQDKVLERRLQELEKTHWAPTTSLFWSLEEGKLMTFVSTLQSVLWQFAMSIHYVEYMLRQQLIQALGKQVTPLEFDAYMKHHNRHQHWLTIPPRPFSHIIRPDPTENPAGVVSIESVNDDDPIQTMVRRLAHTEEDEPVSVPLGASSRVQLTGDRYLHGWLRHVFASQPSPSIRLRARARQFSSFVLLVGTIADAQTLHTKYAMILSNKDQVLIPILTETLPSAQQFRDAIASLSPEQQEFAKAMRTMQLESSVFGIAIVQLKPQLEAVLQLPPGSLDKEIQLTEDLIRLFVDYQIPSGLVSYDGDDDRTAAEKVKVVKKYVSSVLEVIEAQKEEQHQEEKRKASVRKARDESPRHEQDYYEATSATVSPGKEKRRVQTLSMESAEESDEALYTSYAAYTSGGPEHQHRRKVNTMLEDEFVQWHFGDEMMGFQFHSDAFLNIFEMPESDQSSRDNGQQNRQEQQPPYHPLGESLDDGICNDFTMIPRLLDRKLDTLDPTDGALKSTTLTAGTTWRLSRQDNLLVPQETTSLRGDLLVKERNKAMDLLDALSKGGAMPLAKSEVHVLIAMSHCFDETVMNTLVQRNVNPISKVEVSTLLLGSTIYGVPAMDLLSDPVGHGSRLAKASPGLFPSLPDVSSVKADDALEHESNPKKQEVELE